MAKSLELGKEYPIYGEERFIYDMALDLRAQLERLYGPGDTRRQAHPKQHGLLRASFVIEPDLPPDLRVGVFARAVTFPAWIRFSNFNTKPQPDIKKDVRGMAIKLVDVPGEKLLPSAIDGSAQDFLLVSNETFLAKNVKQFHGLVKALTGGRAKLARYALNPLHWPVLARARGEFIRPGNLLQIPYWSTTPYQFGDQSRAVKYHVRPRDTQQDPIPRKPSPWYLREAMIRTLREKEVWFDFMVQFQEDPHKMPTEDPTRRWKSPFVKLATLHIPKQDFTAQEQLTLGQNLSFSPWHSLPAHRPLGGFNRARRAIYHTMYQFRTQRNEVDPSKIIIPKQKPSLMTNKQIVEATLQAYQQKDLAKVLSMMSDDVVWVTQGDAQRIPFAGAHKGKKEVEKMFGIQAATIAVQSFQPLGLIGGEKEATQVFMAHETVEVKKTKKTYEMDFALVITVRDGLIVKVESLMDTQAVADAFV